jgi:hypothetical protein
MDQVITLVCPPGAQDGKISHGDKEFPPYRKDHRDPNSPWLVDVPLEVGRYLCWNAGFRQFDGQ